jgi:hypothetical protein
LPDKKRIAILVSQDYGPSAPCQDDALLQKAFEKTGHQAHIICRDDETIDCCNYSVAIVGQSNEAIKLLVQEMLLMRRQFL